MLLEALKRAGNQGGRGPDAVPLQRRKPHQKRQQAQRCTDRAHKHALRQRAQVRDPYADSSTQGHAAATRPSFLNGNDLRAIGLAQSSTTCSVHRYGNKNALVNERVAVRCVCTVRGGAGELATKHEPAL